MFDIGQALGLAFRIWFRNVLRFGAVGLVAHVPLIAAAFYLFSRDDIELFSGDDGQLIRTLMIAGISMLYSWVTSFLLGAVYTYSVLQQLRGKPADLGSSIAAAGHRLLPLLGVFFLYNLLSFLGLMLFVIPMIFVQLVLCVVVPACVVERLGPTDALERSWNLTSGHRWPVLGLYIVAILAFSVPLMIVFGAATVVPGFLDEGTLPRVLFEIFVEVLRASFVAVLVTVIYHQLRTLKEGVSTDEIAEVFE